MKFKEIVNRLTGFSIPVFGISWKPPELEITVARRVVAFLEDRRVLFNPYYMEDANHCIQSVLDIRKFLTDEIGGLKGDSNLAEHLRGIRAACRKFLNNVNLDSKRISRYHLFGPDGSKFFTYLGELRATIGLHIAAIAVMYGIDVEGELAVTLPGIDEGVVKGKEDIK